MENIIKNLCSLSFITTQSYEENLQTLLNLVKESSDGSIIVAPEVCLTGYDYDNFEAMYEFAPHATNEIKKVSNGKIIALTMLEKRGEDVYNFAKVFKDGAVVYEQAKAKLFKFGDEHKYMTAGNEEDINIFEIDGIKFGLLICFELRFKTLWQKLEGADVILVPAWWGELRRENFKTITQALAVINQCYLVASDSLNEECTGESGIITPFGEVQRNGNKPCLNIPYSPKEIKKMRKYMDVGIG
ncbi:carbon-nitrogen hydrolase family protein [Sulfurimonas lithotrophica]|uniref:Carbon-nitrogen hydrolase family protein n=1 Tax=Sulfurimonas lithotrophica TaxID=2590022 RepID=A0A5P8P3Y2_9BACT|nr:carbon-nitrogen hydrolase family protein [Sulfurimonas lithotrophica]QFR50376.1 carbon-nitrogen hydrolase family protein [Sulfurimonas lithotrophica]